MLYVREFSFEKKNNNNYMMFTRLISLLLPCLKYCTCPAFFSLHLHFALMYIHTRTYWDVFSRSISMTVFCALSLFIHLLGYFVCLFRGGGICWSVDFRFIKFTFICFGVFIFSKILVPGAKQYKGMWPVAKTCSAKWNQGLVALLVTQTTVVYIPDWSRSVNLKHSDSRPFPPVQIN